MANNNNMDESDDEKVEIRSLVSIDDSDEEMFETRSLVSIDYIRVNKVDGMELVADNKIELYGTVVVTNHLVDDIVYNRFLFEPETKALGEHLSLTGPSKEITFYGTVLIIVNLWGKDEKEIANGDIVWRHPSFSPTSRHVQKDVLGQHGSVTVGFSVILEAVRATINIVMRTNQSPPQIYGTVKACRFLGGSSATWTLFDKSANECIPLNPQHSIPLTRPCFPIEVPDYHSDSHSDSDSDSYSTIAVDLWNHDDGLSPDYQIAVGSVKFTPMLGTQKKNITCNGNFGQMEVSITCK